MTSLTPVRAEYFFFMRLSVLTTFVFGAFFTSNSLALSTDVESEDQIPLGQHAAPKLVESQIPLSQQAAPKHDEDKFKFATELFKSDDIAPKNVESESIDLPTFVPALKNAGVENKGFDFDATDLEIFKLNSFDDVVDKLQMEGESDESAAAEQVANKNLEAKDALDSIYSLFEDIDNLLYGNMPSATAEGIHFELETSDEDMDLSFDESESHEDAKFHSSGDDLELDNADTYQVEADNFENETEEAYFEAANGESDTPIDLEAYMRNIENLLAQLNGEDNIAPENLSAPSNDVGRIAVIDEVIFKKLEELATIRISNDKEETFLNIFSEIWAEINADVKTNEPLLDTCKRVAQEFGPVKFSVEKQTILLAIMNKASQDLMVGLAKDKKKMVGSVLLFLSAFLKDANAFEQDENLEVLSDDLSTDENVLGTENIDHEEYEAVMNTLNDDDLNPGEEAILKLTEELSALMNGSKNFNPGEEAILKLTEELKAVMNGSKNVNPGEEAILKLTEELKAVMNGSNNLNDDINFEAMFKPETFDEVSLEDNQINEGENDEDESIDLEGSAFEDELDASENVLSAPENDFIGVADINETFFNIIGELAAIRISNDENETFLDIFAQIFEELDVENNADVDTNEPLLDICQRVAQEFGPVKFSIEKKNNLLVIMKRVTQELAARIANDKMEMLGNVLLYLWDLLNDVNNLKEDDVLEASSDANLDVDLSTDENILSHEEPTAEMDNLKIDDDFEALINDIFGNPENVDGDTQEALLKLFEEPESEMIAGANHFKSESPALTVKKAYEALFEEFLTDDEETGNVLNDNDHFKAFLNEYVEDAKAEESSLEKKAEVEQNALKEKAEEIALQEKATRDEADRKEADENALKETEKAARDEAEKAEGARRSSRFHGNSSSGGKHLSVKLDEKKVASPASKSEDLEIKLQQLKQTQIQQQNLQNGATFVGGSWGMTAMVLGAALLLAC